MLLPQGHTNTLGGKLWSESERKNSRRNVHAPYPSGKRCCPRAWPVSYRLPSHTKPLSICEYGKNVPSHILTHTHTRTCMYDPMRKDPHFLEGTAIMRCTIQSRVRADKKKLSLTHTLPQIISGVGFHPVPKTGVPSPEEMA